MGEVVVMEARPICAERARRRRRCGAVHAFPGPRQVRMINYIAANMATLSDAEAREFLVFHFDVEEERLVSQGIADPEIDRYIFETARAIWARMCKIKVGVA